MGKVRANNALTVVRGKVGELSFAHYQDGRLIVRKAGGPKSNFTPAQLRHQERMARAVLFRKFTKTNPTAYAIYKDEARIRPATSTWAQSLCLRPRQLLRIPAPALIEICR